MHILNLVDIEFYLKKLKNYVKIAMYQERKRGKSMDSKKIKLIGGGAITKIYGDVWMVLGLRY